MTTLQPVRGTHDLLPQQYGKFQRIVQLARAFAQIGGFEEMDVPMFEATEVFARAMGESSDVVSKEMFTFHTKGEESVTLRPEFTAGAVRAFLSGGLQQHLPLKLFMHGPAFRYERPQKGRQRQFHQVDFEWLGDASPEADVEIITLAAQFLSVLSGKDSCTLLINTLGDAQSRAAYKEALVAYLLPQRAGLSADSQRRLDVNPLRILDSKSAEDQEILKAAPSMQDYLSDSAARHFACVQSALSHLQKEGAFPQRMRVSPTLVRGLDYYTGVVFEYISEAGELGAQNTVLAGGRYDGLVAQMGGKPTPAIGFAAGIERLMLLMEEKHGEPVPRTHIVILPLEDVPSEWALLLASLLRFNIRELLDKSALKRRCTVEVYWSGSLTKRLSKAAQRGATHAIVFGGEEYQNKTFKVRDMQTRQEEVTGFEAFTDNRKIRSLFGMH
jgi:histidyl-tRNA synthetase